jgi:ABC-type nickel/cobalt efflux system permease component RcnA
MQTLSGVVLGLLLGMRHALEPDHLTAVSTLVAEHRSARTGARLGVFWGVGHTAALLTVGILLAVLDAKLPQRLADTFELGVAVMLVGLGARSIRKAFLEGLRGDAREHRHGRHNHVHPAGRGHVHVGRLTFASGSLAVGVVHGLAGSGALTVLVLAGMPTTSARLAYLLLFGFGSIAGMAFLSGFAGWPLARLGQDGRLSRGVMFATGFLSLGLGFVWGAPLLGRVFG